MRLTWPEAASRASEGRRGGLDWSACPPRVDRAERVEAGGATERESARAPALAAV